LLVIALRSAENIVHVGTQFYIFTDKEIVECSSKFLTLEDK